MPAKMEIPHRARSLVRKLQTSGLAPRPANKVAIPCPAALPEIRVNALPFAKAEIRKRAPLPALKILRISRLVPPLAKKPAAGPFV